MKHLGFYVHADSRNFSIPKEKIESFASLRCQILAAGRVHIKVLQRLMGKCISFCLCVPAAKLYVREMARAISKATRSSQMVVVDTQLADEINTWEFIERQEVQWMPWREDRHVSILLSTDASKFAWGGVVGEVTVRDMFADKDDRPIHLKEAEALEKTLVAVPHLVRDLRVDAYVDNMALLRAWEHEGAKDTRLNEILKRIFALTIAYNCELKLHYVRSADNPADAPSRLLSPSDAMLAPKSWEVVQAMYGPHTFDLMALDSNVQRNGEGAPLPHYTPCPLPFSSGVNCLAQNLKSGENYYCFPPFCLVQAFVGFLCAAKCRPLTVSLVVPRASPLPSWWPVLHALAEMRPLAGKGECAVMEQTRAGYQLRPVGQPLWLARIVL
jgi:hypothetical protein